MRNKPKLQDILEVFNGKLDSLEEALRELERFEITIDSKIKELQTSKVKVGLEPAREWKKGLINDLSNQKSEFTSLLEANTSQLEGINKEREEKFLQFYIYTGIAFLIALSGMFFGIRAQISQSQLTSEKAELKQHNISMFEFIKENENTEDFRKWLDTKEAQ